MGNIKLIVSDVDGTLIDHTEAISEELIETVNACKNRGILFCLATGRTFELADPIIKKLGIDAPCVEANGAVIVQGEKCLLEHGFSLEPVKDILLDAHRLGLTVTVADAFEERAFEETDYVIQHKAFGGRFKRLLPPDSIDWRNDRFQKVMVMDEHNTGKVESIRERLMQHAERYWITTYSNRAVELGPMGCNKATGVRELAALLGIDMKNVMACGDYLNDLEMITSAGYGVAVGNAHDCVKSAAAYTSSGCYAQGVVEAIHALCFQ